MWDRIKKHPLITGAIAVAAVLTFVGGVWGGVDAIGKGWGWATKKPIPPPTAPEVKLALVNVDFAAAQDGTNPKRDQYRMNLAAILTNHGKDPIRAMVTEAESNIGEYTADAPAGDFPERVMGPGVSVIADVDSISFPLKPGQYLEGRINWTIKYGPASGTAIETMKISGSLGVRRRKGEVFPTWVPDAGSALPVGQTPKVVFRPADSPMTSAEAATTQAVSDKRK